MKHSHPIFELRKFVRPKINSTHSHHETLSSDSLSSLPVELLLAIIEDLPHIDRFSLRLTCSRLYNLLSTSQLCRLLPQLAQFGVKWERDSISALLHRDRFYHLHHQFLNSPEAWTSQALCWQCKHVHPKDAFFEAQLATSAFVRGCKRDAVVRLPQAAGINMSYSDARRRAKRDFGSYWDEAGVYVPWNAQVCTASPVGIFGSPDQLLPGESETSTEKVDEEEQNDPLPIQLRRYTVLRKKRLSRFNAIATLRIELELSGFHGSQGFLQSECGYPVLAKMHRHEAVDICAHINTNSDSVIGLAQHLKPLHDDLKLSRARITDSTAIPMKSRVASCQICGTEFWLAHLIHRWNFRIRNSGLEQDLPNYGFFVIVEKKLGKLGEISDPLKNAQWLRHVELPP